MQQRKAPRVLFFLVIIGQFSVRALAQESTDEMETCFRLTDPAARLDCFDHEMQRRHSLAARGPRVAPIAPVAEAAPPVVPNAPSVTTAIQRPPDNTVGLDGKQLLRKRKEEGIQPEAVKPIVATIVRLQPRPGHLYYFELDNGQLWESTDTQGDLFLAPHETVTIKPGLLGAFFLLTQEGHSIRVHRLR
jgi:hypothetical protein